MMVAAPVEGGFVAATEVLEEGAGAAVGDAPEPGAAATGPMRWNNNTSRFVLRRMAQLLSDGSRPEKVFKNKGAT